ncbi:arginine--tRNA ligase [Holdemania massiliensis]|uniref:Arginine--tRNA ligase n=1 Tax=Holdemania massiliensis TaxID=1468449 RepID=A0A6N7S4E6_9FIRM|nr:arginine--tRNA ligase [Holdemania massiliensis]MSA69883.1 arginine--tRNA ligase [Holdemania massiliensis]MSA88649.1 arginine--tRNA ligase [Holdemania massiliensis]MSB77270.1 arginine--tRNA ligase [Holdemania massiliensis]MSC32196.1 arginine--tRNA ligase [Holdemania massiliensis]MSC38429.1 arginine--tRNA ligase [Holdemania massiliensis]
MNQIETNLKNCIMNAVKQAFDFDLKNDDVVIEIPKEKIHGDYSTNTAMRLTKQLHQNPRMIAQQLIDHLDLKQGSIAKCEIAGPGFINFFMESASLASVIGVVLQENENYGRSDAGQGLKVDVEYVSANPTGDLHPGHARGAAMGDSVTRLMKFAGYDVTREYYVNDAGNQIRNMALSLQARYLQACGVEAEVPEDGYHGPDLIKIAQDLKQEYGEELAHKDKAETYSFFRQQGLQAELAKLKADLAAFGVEFDVWTSEQSIYDRGMVDKALTTLKAQGMTYESEGALWLRTTDFGDDKDRVLVKSDGSYTYLTPDIAYHVDKFDRGYDKLIDFFGADHHGYIARLKAAVQSLGKNKDDLEVDIIQMARMVKDGEEFKMSKRTGKAVALKDLVEEAGVDAVRYFFVSRAADTHMDFDIDMAKKQTNENPVYYAQYAHARMCSILRSGADIALADHYELITHEKELDLLKHINEFASTVADAAKTRQPHKMCNYITRLAQLFHTFYADCKVLDRTNLELSAQRLALVKASEMTLRNALTLIGVSAPEKM